MQSQKSSPATYLKKVQSTLGACLKNTNLAPFLPPKNNIMGSGKMLRAQLTIQIGLFNQNDEKTICNAAASVEIIHGASLLHDDVIDGGVLRRGAPTFWKKHGVNGTILLGDLLVFEGLNLLLEVNRHDLVSELIQMSRKVCLSEVQQELILRGTPGTWEDCEEIARSKTGSLFAFAALAGSEANNPTQAAALKEAGFILGTAYQLVDDILDDSGNEAVSGKTLGQDQVRGKTTSITALKNAPADPLLYIDNLLIKSAKELSAWPDLQATWNCFLTETIKPILHTYLNAKQNKGA